MIFCIGEKKANLSEQTKSSHHSKSTKWQHSEGSEGARQEQEGGGSATLIKGGTEGSQSNLGTIK